MRLLNRSPFPADPSEVAFRDERIRLRADQIILWVTLTIKRITAPNPSATPLPVILDTGHTHTFSIRERHLIDWAGIRPEAMALLGHIRDREQRIPLRAANIWVHSNERGSRDRLAEKPPHSLAAPKGIAVYPGEFPRLPLLGLRALADNRLILNVDGPNREATLRTPLRWWPFG
jgi:hypothetical protein